MVSESPWTNGLIAFRRAAFDAAVNDAIERYRRNEEACGYFTGPSDDAPACDECVVLENLANKLHRLDPETYFRDARTFFAFNEKKFDDAVNRGREAGRPVKVLYHSHLDAGAYFSPTDQAIMSMGEPPSVEGGPFRLGTGPAWPLAFLVLSVSGGDQPKLAESRMHIWAGDRFHEVPVREPIP
jgi:[CysO sulfur-carrier protein]-S-L-cysteine hydrolase